MVFKKRRIGIGILIGLSLALSFVSADTPWCNDEPQCPFIYASVCDCMSTQTGTECFLIPCGDINNDGCYELDYNNKYRCPYECEQTGTYTAECTYAPSPCQSECEIGQSECVGAPPSYEYQGHSVRKCVDDDFDGCGEWAESLESCYPFGCLQSGLTADCKFVEPSPRCEDTCLTGQMKCVYIAGQSYRDTCGNYDDDSCKEFYSEANPGMLGIGMEFCPFGCEEPQSKHAVCKIEPEVCQSTCKDGNKMCGGDGSDIFTCAYNSKDACWQYFDQNGNAFDVQHCEWGCEESLKGNATCLFESTGFNLEFSTSLYSGIRGIFKHGEYFYLGDGTNQNVYRFYSNSSFRDIYFTSNTSRAGYIDTDGKYIWISDVVDDIVSKYFFNGTWVQNVSIPGFGMAGIEIDGDYVYLHEDTNQEIAVLFKNGTEYNRIYYNYEDLNIDVPGMAKHGDYFWIGRRTAGTPGSLEGIYKFYYDGFTLDFVDSYLSAWYFQGIDYSSTIPGTTGENKLYFSREITSPSFHHFYSFSEEIMIEQNKCRPGSKKCMGEMYVGGRWIRPYLIYCSDLDGDGYYEYPESLEDGGSTTGISCIFGCHYNNTIGDIECRANAPVNCTDKEWKCIPGRVKCDNSWTWICEDTYNDNCYAWRQQTYCLNGCLGSNCKSCENECSYGESKCFNEGWGGVDPDTLQSVGFNTPVVMNCSYDANMGCYLWDLQQMERCVYGCYNTFNYSTNRTSGICRTRENIDQYHLGNFSNSIQGAITLVTGIFQIAMPDDGTKYITFSLASVFIVGLVVVKSKSVKLGLFVFALFLLFGGLIGWIPIWITILMGIGSGLFLMRKFFFKGDE